MSPYQPPCPVRYHVDARRRVYAVMDDGSHRRLQITAEELERQMQLALQHRQDYTPDLDKPGTPRSI